MFQKSFHPRVFWRMLLKAVVLVLVFTQIIWTVEGKPAMDLVLIDFRKKNCIFNFSTFVEDFRLIWDFISYKSVKTMKQTKNHSTCLYSDVTVVPLQQIVNLIWRQMQIVSSYKTVFRPCINVILNFLFFIDRRNVWSNPVPQWSRWLLFSTA